MTHKVCPVLLRGRGGATEILAFRHPLAGRQIVKGTVEPGERLEAAAIREMHEESGLRVSIERPLGRLRYRHIGQIWHFFLCRPLPCPDRWTHRTNDGGPEPGRGLVFSFYWHPLNATPDGAWHPDFVRALEVIAERVCDHA